jgi:Arc/MetJ-type ribon-helix-helix transcriptional regulator
VKSYVIRPGMEPSMMVHLSKELEQFIHDAVSMGFYAREDDVIRDAVTRLKQAMPDAAAPPAKRAKPAGKATKNPLTIEELHQQMAARGLITLPDTAADFDDPDDEPIAIKGEPLSETVIRERR